jgi:hypothetical protein
MSPCNTDFVVKNLGIMMNDMGFLGIIFKVRIQQRWAHATFFFESAITILLRKGNTFAIANPQLFKEMLLHNSNTAIAIFSEVRNVRASLPQFSAYFWLWNPVES